MRLKRPFQNQMSRLQTVLGWIYLPLHAVALPVLLALYASVASGMTDAKVNLLYYGIGVCFVLVVMLRYLRRCFDVLLDNFRLCLMCIALALLVDYAMSTVAALLLLLLPAAPENPNNSAIMDAAAQSYGVMKGLVIFIGPIVEEILFRGVVFGSIRTRSRGWAYVVSVVLFSVYHVWQYALASGDPVMLLYAIQYVPVSVALAWAYERSGSIWTTVFFHMGFNAVSFLALSIMERM